MFGTASFWKRGRMALAAGVGLDPIAVNRSMAGRRGFTRRTAIRLPPLNLAHLLELGGDEGIYEHAFYKSPRVWGGYTTDDNARALVLFARLGMDSETPLVRRCLTAVIRAFSDGAVWNRRTDFGGWTEPSTDGDVVGRAIWGLSRFGLPDEKVRERLEWLLLLESPYLRTNALAALGAAELVARYPEWSLAKEALGRFVERIEGPGPGQWKWPEKTLTYANGRIPHALLEAGIALEDESLVERGLELLSWLVDVETGPRGFSFTPVAGRSGGGGAGFDQQPIEAWAIADACEAAYRCTGEPVWYERILDAALWFCGHNDTGALLYDPATGAGFDGLEIDGVNQNCGAESTIAALCTLQIAHSTLGNVA